MLRSSKTILLHPVLESHRCRRRSWRPLDLPTACYGQDPGQYLRAVSHTCAAQSLALLTAPQKLERAPPRSDYACTATLEPNYRFLTKTVKSTSGRLTLSLNEHDADTSERPPLSRKRFAYSSNTSA